MKRTGLFFAACLLASPALAQAPSPASMGITSGTPQVLQVLDKNKNWVPLGAATGAIDPRAFGAKCDRMTDDTAALTAWAAAITDRSVARVVGQCVTRSPIVFPLAARASLLGDGIGASKLVYAGSDTTVTPFVFGQPDVNNGCSLSQWSIRGISFESDTLMTAGDAVKFQGMCESDFVNLSFGSRINGTTYNGNWFNGAHFIAGNSNNLRSLYAYGHNVGTGLLVNGTLTTTDIGLFMLGVKIIRFDVGLDYAGNVGGPVIDQSDILFNNTDVRISQSQVAKGNTQIMLNAGVQLDVTNSGPNLDITDPGINSASRLFINGSWIATSATHCIDIRAGSQFHVQMNGGTLYNCGNGVSAAQADGLRNESTASFVALNGVTISTNTGYGVNSTVANSNISIQGGVIQFNTLAAYSSNVTPNSYSTGQAGTLWVGSALSMAGNATQPTDQHRWDQTINATTGDLIFRSVKDDYSNAATVMTFNRNTGFNAPTLAVSVPSTFGVLNANPLTGVGVAPSLQFRATQPGSQPADQHNWDWVVDGSGNINMRSLNDAYGAANVFMKYNRGSGYSLTGASVNFSTPITATALPTAAGGGGLYVCVDSAGVMYKKAACP